MVSTYIFSNIYCNAAIVELVDIFDNNDYNSNKYKYKRTTMRKSTRSILQELSDIGLSRDTDMIIESRASNVIQSAINLLDMIRENYDIETATELERRFLNSIKASDPSKFKRGIKKIQENKQN